MTIENLNKLNAKLDKIANMDVSEGILKGCLRVERDAKILVPVLTGMLRNSITHNVEGSVGEVGTSIEYAAAVELGLRQKAQPFLQPALDLNRTLINQDIQEAIAKQLRGIIK